MNAFWSYFWPPLAMGIAIGMVAGLLAIRRHGRQRNFRWAAGVLAAIVAAALWHGPLGGADAFASSVERSIRATTVFYEIPEVSGRLNRGPMTRRVTLAGPADDFQRTELVRLMNDLPGVAGSSWSEEDAGGLPLIVEGSLAALAGFLLGLLVAYLVELRRRYKANKKW